MSYDDDYATGSLAVEDALLLPLIFHMAQPLTDHWKTEWKRITGTEEMTTRMMCDHLRMVYALVKHAPGLHSELEKLESNGD